MGSVGPEWLTHPAIMSSREYGPGSPLGLSQPDTHPREVHFCGIEEGRRQALCPPLLQPAFHFPLDGGPCVGVSLSHEP